MRSIFIYRFMNDDMRGSAMGHIFKKQATEV